MYACIKRGIDFVLSLLGLAVLSPVFLALIIAIKIDSPGPILFRQKRVGIHKTHFAILKFRTMRIDTPKDVPTHLLQNPEQYITKVGRFLRKTSLDELPQIINILKGDMSIVGPRPQLVRDMVFMTREQRRRHRVAQGLTGLAQVNGRNNISWEEKLSYDQKYVKRITFLGDLRILLRTVGNVWKKEDINTDGMATAEDLGDYLLRTGQVDRETYDRKQRIAERLCEKNS